MLRVVVSNKDRICSWSSSCAVAGDGLPGDLDTRRKARVEGEGGKVGEDGEEGRGGKEGKEGCEGEEEKSSHLEGADSHDQSCFTATTSSLLNLELPVDPSLMLVLAADLLCYGFKPPQVPLASPYFLLAACCLLLFVFFVISAYSLFFTPC